MMDLFIKMLWDTDEYFLEIDYDYAVYNDFQLFIEENRYAQNFYLDDFY